MCWTRKCIVSSHGVTLTMSKFICKVSLLVSAFMAATPSFARAQNEPMCDPPTVTTDCTPYADYHYNSFYDVNEWVVFAQAGSPPAVDKKGNIITTANGVEVSRWHHDWDTVVVDDQTYTIEATFKESGATWPLVKVAQNRGPAGNECVVIWRPTVDGTELVEQGVGALAVDLVSSELMPIIGIISAFWGTPTIAMTDTYYYARMMDVASDVEDWLISNSCSEIVTTGWSMGGAMAQFFAFRSWQLNPNGVFVDAVYAFNPGPVGNASFRRAYNDLLDNNAVRYGKSATSDVYCRRQDKVRNASLLYFDSIDPFWELGCNHVGSAIDYNWNDGSPPDHDLYAWRTCGLHGSWSNQCPNSLGQHGTSSDDVSSVGNFYWTSAGSAPDNFNCINLSDGNWGFGQHYLCSWEKIGIAYSEDGPIESKKCTHIAVPADSSWGKDKYLCVQQDSAYDLSWYTSNAAIPLHQNCIEVTVPNTDGWSDNWLCWETTSGRESAPGIFPDDPASPQ